MFQHIRYEQLNSKQKKSLESQKLAAELVKKLAHCGYSCAWFREHWQGVDFIACHVDGDTMIPVQIKGRLTMDKNCDGQGIHIAFNENGKWYLYPHDQLQSELLQMGLMSDTESWDEKGLYTWPRLSQKLAKYMEQYVI